MDPQVYARRRYDECRQELAWRHGTREAMNGWQRKLRERLRKLVGGQDLPRPTLRAEVHEAHTFPQYRREVVRFESRPGMEVFGYFLTPTGLQGRQPGVLCLPGHGYGVDSIVGIREDRSQRPWGEWGDYQADFALQCVAHGYPTFAIEQVSFGHRRDAKAQDQGGGASSCTRDSMGALMLGETMTGWRVWDASRALDYMAGRPEVDPQRLVTMGISGGGLTSLWIACLDTRVHTAVVSGYFNTFRSSILAVDHCVDNYVPGLLPVVEMPDMAGLVAPRRLFVEGGSRDTIFPQEAFRYAVGRAREIFTAFGVPERFGSEEFEGDHHFHGKGAFQFLQQKLGAPRTAGP